MASATLVAGAALPPAPWRSRSKVNRFRGPARVPSRTPEPGSGCDGTSARERSAQSKQTGSPSDRGLEPREGRVTYYRHKKETRQENPGQKSTISFNAAALALGTNNLDVHSRDLI